VGGRNGEGRKKGRGQGRRHTTLVDGLRHLGAGGGGGDDFGGGEGGDEVGGRHFWWRVVVR